jgi:pyrroline-5-carboxylate reductase
MKATIGFIGGGRITKIFLEGFKNKAAEFDSVIVYEPDSDTLKKLKVAFPEIKTADTPGESARTNVVILAVHPPAIMETLENIAGDISEDTIVVSLAPKITIEKISSRLKTTKIVRMIPNATSYCSEGYNPVSYHDSMTKQEKKKVRKLFKPLGKMFETQEFKLEGYAIVSAMLPTYFWFQWKEMEDIAVKTGLSPEEAQKAVKSTLKKAIKLYYNSGLTPEEVMDLIPVKPIGENESDIKNTLNTKLLGLFEKIKP